MWIILAIGSFIAFMFGFGLLLMAKSAIHEIEAFVLFLISSVLFVGAALIKILNAIRTHIEYANDLAYHCAKQQHVNFPDSITRPKTSSRQ